MAKWSILYERAIRKDGSLLFPERLTKEFLESARRTMGSYLFANQYQNEVIPDEDKSFRPEWLRQFRSVPTGVYRFGFIDPAIGQDKHHDYTGIAVVEVDYDGIWYLRLAKRERLTPTEIVDKMFELCNQFQLKALGVEIVAFQEALLYILSERMKERRVTIPVKGIQRSKTSKNSRILGLVPRFEWGRILISQGMVDFEDEYNTFPRGQHDDILDAIASLEELVFYPSRKEEQIVRPHSEHHPDYEKWWIRERIKQQAEEQGG